MKFVETLGRHRGQKGIFQYKRSSDGVTISSRIGNAPALNPDIVELTRQEWRAILQAIEGAAGQSFGLTAGGGGGNPTTALYDFIEQALPNPAGGWNWQAPWLAFVCAILEHEGSVELYSGALGQGYQAQVTLTRDIP